MAYTHQNSKGQTYYLHQRDVTLRGGRVQRIFFFAREVKDGSIDSLPAAYTVIENPRTGLPILRIGGRKGPPAMTPSASHGNPEPDVSELALDLDSSGFGLTLLSEPGVVEAPDGHEYAVEARFEAASEELDEGIRELRRLLASDATAERDYQRCLEDHQELLTVFGHQESRPQLVLEGATGALRPDFVLCPVHGDLWDVLDLKRPTIPLVRGNPSRPRPSHDLAQALAQLRHYAEALEDPREQDRIRDRYGIDFLRPRLYLIAGRRERTDARGLRRIQSVDWGTKIYTWDDLLDHAHHRSQHRR